MGQVTTYYKGDMLFESKLAEHTIVTDVPASMGGKGRAPTPPELFVASLGACVAAFVANYCGNAGVDLRDMSVDVTFDKTGDPARLSNFRVLINIPHGDFAAREQAILRVAEHCPVHETIMSVDDIEIALHTQQTVPLPV